tara:strand:+ start:247 stop:1533 length:1287 start_codon:yes stop_codon:yes gene_type:complete
MNNKCIIQLFTDNSWHDAVSVTLTSDEQQGWKASTRAGYTLDHVLNYQGMRDAHACTYQWPVSMELLQEESWPPFLLDLLPQGFGRQELLRQLNLPETATYSADWALLLAGAGNPIGNLRIKEAAERNQQENTPLTGFHYSDIANRHEDFVEYLASHGLFVAGSSGVQGEWPKILLTEADDGLLYLDHTLPDYRARKHWLVKFQRSNQADLKLILECEAKYMSLARHLGLRVHGELENHNGALFIPRFDRRCEKGNVTRIAQESLASLCQKAGFGLRMTHNEACTAIAEACNDPEQEIIEYLKRDMANIILGNKDNHSRNTAINRAENGYISLAPLFDFAPMYLHPEGIARSIRWAQDDNGQPDWNSVIKQAAIATGLPPESLTEGLKPLLSPLRSLGEEMHKRNIPTPMIERAERLAEIAVKSLEAI